MPLGYSKFAQDAQNIRRSITILDALALSARYQEHVRFSKAMTLVWMTAAVEDFWKRYLSELCARVESAGTRKKRRNIGVSSIFFFDSMGTLGEGRKLKRWEKAIAFFEDIKSPATSSFAVPHDGRTVRPEHIQLAWRLFGLDGNQFPTPIHRQELTTLADRRNDVAHGNLTPQQVGGAVSIEDLKRILVRLEDIVEHCVNRANEKW